MPCDFYECRVPGVLSPACQCGWRRQDPKHVTVFCPGHVTTRSRLYEGAGTQQYQKMLSTRRGLGALARWMMERGLQHLFLLAKEQIDRVEGEGRARGGDDNDGEGEGLERAE